LGQNSDLRFLLGVLDRDYGNLRSLLGDLRFLLGDQLILFN
jgi:hypothetical protein